MKLPTYSRQRRIHLAEEIEAVMVMIFSLIRSDMKQGRNIDRKYYEGYLGKRYKDAVEKNSEINLDDYPEIEDYIDEIIVIIIGNTIDKQNDDYYTSNDRARDIGEEESNTVHNGIDYKDAKKAGYTRKQWVSMKDSRVRQTHWEVDDNIVPIDGLFEVGDSLMRYPRDPNGSPEEIVGCRCTIKYLK